MKTKKHQAIWDWLMSCPHFQSLFFVFPQIDDNGIITNNQVSLTPEAIGGDDTLNEFIDGSKIKQYTFAVAQYSMFFREVNIPTNINIIGVFENIVDWIEQQSKEGSFPHFPQNCHIEEIKAYPGAIAGEDETGVKMQFSTQIKYLEEREE